MNSTLKIAQRLWTDTHQRWHRDRKQALKTSSVPCHCCARNWNNDETLLCQPACHCHNVNETVNLQKENHVYLMLVEAESIDSVEQIKETLLLCCITIWDMGDNNFRSTEQKQTSNQTLNQDQKQKRRVNPFSTFYGIHVSICTHMCMFIHAYIRVCVWGGAHIGAQALEQVWMSDHSFMKSLLSFSIVIWDVTQFIRFDFK